MSKSQIFSFVSCYDYKGWSDCIAGNVDGLLLCWYFIMSSPEPQPIEKLMMKITTKAHLYSSAQTKADSEQNDENMFVCQHSSKPNVVCRHSLSTELLFPFIYFIRRHCGIFVKLNEKCLSVNRVNVAAIINIYVIKYLQCAVKV